MIDLQQLTKRQTESQSGTHTHTHTRTQREGKLELDFVKGGGEGGVHRANRKTERNVKRKEGEGKWGKCQE